MKSLFVCCITFLLSGSLFGQQPDTVFTLSPAGFNNNGDAYFVKYYPAKTRGELYRQYDSGIVKLYASERNLITQAKDSFIQIRATAHLNLLKAFTHHYFDVLYNLRFEFENGKVIISAPLISSMTSAEVNNEYLVLKFSDAKKKSQDISVFNEDGSVQFARAKQELETFFNDLLFKKIVIGADAVNASKSVLEQLKEWKALLDSGAITQEEYEQQKKKLLSEP